MSENKVQPVTLITFDVDGTLVSSSGPKGCSRIGPSTHAKAFLHAAGSVYGTPEFITTCESPMDYVPTEKYHGSTDGIILLNLINEAFNVSPEVASKQLPILYNHMHNYFASFSDDEVFRDMIPLPGVIDTLNRIVTTAAFKDKLVCGLVTGNVEGLARKKMRSVGIFQTGIFAPKSMDQQVWEGEENTSFLGGFGSDYCSGNISDISRLYKDRGEQIAIAYHRARSQLRPDQRIVRVVHVGDATADVLAAKYCYEENRFSAVGDDFLVTVGCVGVATGKYSAEHLRECAGSALPGRWEPVVLEDGLNDPAFIDACGIVLDEVEVVA
jgi:phosphoglycolate phosphatase-like HAD superfamily hydrolase